MRVRVFATADAATCALARTIAEAVRRKPDIVLGLPTGRTPIPVYEELSRLAATERLDFSRVITFNLDEFVGVSRRDRGSYRRFMEEHFFGRVNMSKRHIHFLNGTAARLETECDRYEAAIARAGGVDLQILGLGANGHIGFNEPAASLIARTHVATLKPSTRRANRALFGNRAARVPRAALSMGMATILQARRIVLLATGAEKARSAAGMLNGCVTPRLPASFLQLHRECEVWLDRAAAGMIGNRRS